MLQICNVTFAQMSRLYTTQSGLTTSDIYSIDVDSKGLAWISGVSSLDVFDGSRFCNISALLNSTNGFTFNAVRKVVEYKDDKYWLATSNGLFLLDGKKNKLYHKFLRADEDSVLGFSINHIIDYPKPNLKLVSTEGNGLFVFDQDQQKVDTAETNKLRKAVPYLFCSQIYIDSDNVLWGDVMFRQIFRVDLNTMEHIDIKKTPAAERTISSSNVNVILQQTSSGNLYFATDEGMLIYDCKEQILRTPKIPHPVSMPITTLHEDGNGRILVGTDNHGLWGMLPDESMETFYSTDPKMNIEFAKVRSFTADKEGNLIIALAQKGLFVLPNNTDRIAYYSFSPNSNHINATSVTSIAYDGTNYWVATDGCGVYELDLSTRFVTPKYYSNGLKSSLIQSIAVDKHNTVWTASYGGGVQYLENDHFVTPEWLGNLTSTYAMILEYYPPKDLLFVGTNGEGVFVIDLANKTVSNIFTVMSFNGWIYSLHCDDYDNLWIGTAQGIFRYNINKKTGGEIRFPRSDMLMPQCITTMNNILLVGTNKGLISYNKRTAEVTTTLPEENIKSIEVADKDIWVSTAKNIIRIDKQTMKAYTYTSFGGYYMGEFHRNAHFMTDNNQIMFGGDNGIISFNAAQMRQPKHLKHDIYFTSIKVNGHNVIYNENSSRNIMDANVIALNRLSLNHDENSISISFGVPDFTAPSRMCYQYFLEGYDNVWHNVIDVPEAYYSNVSPGNYTLHIKAFYENNEQEAVEKSLEINIREPWYNSMLAWILYFIILFIILFFVYKAYRERIKQKKLFTLVRQTEQLKEAKLRMFTSIAHELRSPLTMILSPLNQLIASTEDKGLLGMYNVMKLNCDRLINIVKQITDIRKIDNGQFHLHFSEVDFATYSDYIFESFSIYANAKHITYTIEHTNPNVNIWLDKVHFEKILANLLSNAFKYTPEGGRILVRTKCILKDAQDWFEIKIYNSGSHINDNDMPHIFERFFQANNITNENIGSGIGLNLTNELVNLHHGRIEARNVDPDGVEFVMVFPLHNVHLTEEELLPRIDSEIDDEETKNDDLFSDIEIERHEEVENEPSTEKGQRTILVVDDDRNLCSYIKSQMLDTYNVITAFSGNAAWNEVLRIRPDAVITDIHMPDGNGLELCKRIKSNPETDNMPVIMLTSEISDKAQIHGLQLQVDHFIHKPFNIQVLKSAVQQCLQTRETMMERMRRKEVGYDYTSKTIESPDDKLFARIHETLKKNLDDSTFGVNELATKVGVSRVHLNRKMKERYGVTPNNFIRSYRLKQAAYLLAGQHVNVSEVAYKVGFSSHSHFSNTFHDYFAMTPKEFIAHYAANPDDETLKKLLEI